MSAARVIGYCGVTEKCYEEVGSSCAFDATVVECRPCDAGGYALVLDRTAFFPEGGGQYADRGVIDGVAVQDVQILDGALLHYVEVPFAPGARVHGKVDAEARFLRMQHHTGEHILSGLVHALYGYDNVGFHLSDEEMTMDFDGPLNEAQLRDLEGRANVVIRENHRVYAEYPDSETLSTLIYRSKLDLTENVRIVTIDGVDVCACCAPHLAGTAQVGVLRIVESMSYKGGVRLWVACGERAMQLWQTEHDALDAIARAFSVGRADAAEAVTRMQKENGELRGLLGQCRRELLGHRIEAAAAESKRHLLLFGCDDDAHLMRYGAQEGATRCEGLCGLFSAPVDGVCRYVCISDHLPLRGLAKQLHEVLGGRGGGSDRMIQGSVTADEATIRDFLETV